MSIITFRVTIPTDEAFIGRECNRPGCKRYFRVHSDCFRDQMRCPYCGTMFPNDHLHTKEQVEHFERVAHEKLLEYAHGEIDRTLGKFAREIRGNSFLKFNYKPTRYRTRPVRQNYREHKVDSELQCPECSFQFQVFGIFGLCPGCGTENLRVYDANLAIIRLEIERSDNQRRGLRHAYGDLVSTFEIFCSRKAEKFHNDKPSFQDLSRARKYFKQTAGVDILATLTSAEFLTLHRVFQKRHVCEHADSKVTERYVRKIPEDRGLLGQEVPLSLAEFESGAQVIRKGLDRLCRAFEPRR